MVDFYIDEVCPKSEPYAFIAHFQNGYPTDNFADQECHMLEHKITRKKWVASEINNILYTGEECEQSLGKTLVLTRNRKTNKVRLIEVGNIEIKPILTKYEIEATKQETSYVELGRKFGSKRHKRLLEQNEKLKVNQEVVKEQLKNVSHNISLKQLDLSSYNKPDSGEFYIPFLNQEANNLEDLYTLSAILNPEQYETIFNEISDNPYQSNLFPYINKIFSDTWSKEQMVLAVYASTLLNLYVKSLVEMKTKKFVACPYSATLDQIILKEFFVYNNSARLRPTQYKDKAICHAIVLIFLLNNYKVDITELSKHTKITEKMANMKIIMTGAWILKEGTKKMGVLKLPLNKASTRIKRKK